MRLVDANALKESVRKKFKALPDRCEINELVNAAPTVNAIPVEWLEKKLHEGYHRMCTKAVLDMWQNEQEV